MYTKSEFGTSSHDEHSGSQHRRLILILAAICWLSVGAVVEMKLSEMVRENDDKRIPVNRAAGAPDALSATFAMVARDVEPCVAHINVYESEVYGREGTGSG